MEKDGMNSPENVYFKARKNASEYNERLASREGAAELLDISPSQLAKYELGITKSMPREMVMLMADLYRCPELKSWHCKNECPIGKSLAIATECKSIENIAVRLLKAFKENSVDEIKNKILDIAEDGVISEEELPELNTIVDDLEKLSLVISEVKMAAEKAMGRNKNESKGQ